MNLYKEHALKYFHKGINVIPDGYMSKVPPRGFKGWTQYCDSPVSKDNIMEWGETYTNTNIAVPLGAANNLCVIDVDTTDARLVEFLADALPPSPVERVGSKGFVRFYRAYPGAANYAVKDVLGNIVFEILAKNKKITIPPSVHPAGMMYKWVDRGLLCLESLDELPILPPLLVTNVEHMLQAKFPDNFGSPRIINNRGASANLVNGRTDALKKECFRLISDMDKGKPIPLAVVASLLVSYDLEHHEENPLFSDLSEQGQQHTHAQTNAMKFVISMLDYIQSKRFKENKVYITINNGGFVSEEEQKIYEIGINAKFDNKGNPKPIKNRRINYEWD